MMKKLVSLVLALMLCLSCVSALAAEASDRHLPVGSVRALPRWSTRRPRRFPPTHEPGLCPRCQR